MRSLPDKTLCAAKAVTPRPAKPAIWVLGSLKLTAGAPGRNRVPTAGLWGSRKKGVFYVIGSLKGEDFTWHGQDEG